MKQVLDQAAQRVSCTFDAFADDAANVYIATHQQQRRLARHDAMLKQARWKQWAVRITSDPVRSFPLTTRRLACKVANTCVGLLDDWLWSSLELTLPSLVFLMLSAHSVLDSMSWPVL